MAAIQLTSREDAQKPFWADYWELMRALETTKGILRSLGVTEFPESPTEPLVLGGEPFRVQGKRTPRNQRGPSLTAAIREACLSIKEGITKSSVIEYINEKYHEIETKDASVSSILGGAMVDKGIIKKLEKGEGGRENVYELTEFGSML